MADNVKNLDGVRRTPNGQAYFPSNNKKIVTVSYYVPRPVSINVNYNITIKTNYLQQMNILIQMVKLIYHLGYNEVIGIYLIYQ